MYRFSTGFKEPSSSILMGIIEFNQHLLILVSLIITLIGWGLYYVILNFNESISTTNRRFTHSKELEILWTTIPALVLVVLSVPSFTLLYAMDEAAAPEMTLKIIGHQWFWCYEIDDFLRVKVCELSSLKRVLRYTAYLLVIEGIPGDYPEGYLRLMETTKRVLLPVKTFLRLLVTSSDVLHSWSVPSFGIKMDACPGRLNQINLFIEKVGMYYGACYEICGIQHGFMPISIVATLKENLLEKISTFKS